MLEVNKCSVLLMEHNACYILCVSVYGAVEYNRKIKMNLLTPRFMVSKYLAINNLSNLYPQFDVYLATRHF